MKVQYIKEYTDEHGMSFCKGWTAEHTDAEGQARIDAGVCVKVADDARARRSEFVFTECIQEPPPQGNNLQSDEMLGFFAGAALADAKVDYEKKNTTTKHKNK